MEGERSISWLNKLRTNLFAPQNLQELLKWIDKAHDNNLIDYDTKSMILGVLNISTRNVSDIMIPRSQMVTVKIDMEISDIIYSFSNSSHTRVPVFDDTKEDVLGILHAKDVLYLQNSKDNITQNDIKNILRKSIFIPESKRLDTLLKEFKNTHTHIAIVVDEYGSIAGLITIEDILEEIVGDIEDEFDELEIHIQKSGENEYIINAILEIDEFNRAFNSNFNDEFYDTLGGLILHTLERLPKKGEKILIDNFEFIATEVDNRKIHKVTMKKLK